MMLINPAVLRAQEYTGLTHDGGRTSTPYATWVGGRIVLWTADVKAAWARLREEVVERGIGIEKTQGRLVFTE